MFKVNNKDTRTTTSFWCFDYKLWTYFTPCSGVSILNFEQAYADWVNFCRKNYWGSSRSFYVHLFKDLRITPSWITFVNHQTSWLVYANEFSWIIQSSEAAVRRCSVKKMFWEISQNSLEKNCARVSFLQNTFGRLLLNHIYLPRK